MDSKESIAYRLSAIIIKLNAGESLSIDELVEEFGTSKRTIQRDINERLAFLPIERSNGKISLSAIALGQLNQKDIRNFAQLCGVGELFPKLDSTFITSILSNAYQAVYLVMGNSFEHDRILIGQQISKFETAIIDSLMVEFSYKDKSYKVAPYKLINYRQVWYLAALDGVKIKTFHLASIEKAQLSNTFFKPRSDISVQIENSDDIYLAQDATEVVLKVSKEIAHYFTRQDILPQQNINKKLENGELIVSCVISYDQQIVSTIKQWMPHLQVISPHRIHELVLRDIALYNQFSNAQQQF